jgi:quinol-cytochrome oxidoreductase complex cytochrome b subunit
MKGKRISRYFFIIGIIFVVYLVALSIVGNSEEINPFFYYGFWLVLGVLVGFRLCAYLYQKEGKQFNDKTRLK